MKTKGSLLASGTISEEDSWVEGCLEGDTVLTVPERQVFVVGCYRSGTTVMRLMLSAHPKVYISMETNYIDRIGASLPSFGNLEEKANLMRLHEKITSYLLGERWNSVPDFSQLLTWTQVNGYSYKSIVSFYGTWGAWMEGREELLYWGDNTPRYIHSMSFLKALFPDAKFIHMVRDPRDVVASALRLPLGGKTPLGIAYDWERALLSGLAAESLWGSGVILRVKYEDLVTNPESILKRICNFLEISFTQEMLFFHRSEAAKELSRLRHHRRVSKPLDSESVGRYRRDLPPKVLQIVESYLSELMLFMSYSSETEYEKLLNLRLGRPHTLWMRLGWEALLRSLSVMKDRVALGFTRGKK